MSDVFNLEIETVEQLSTLMKFLDNFAVDLGNLMNYYEDKLHFSEDLIFLNSEKALRESTLKGVKVTSRDLSYMDFYRQFA